MSGGDWLEPTAADVVQVAKMVQATRARVKWLRRSAGYATGLGLGEEAQYLTHRAELHAIHFESAAKQLLELAGFPETAPDKVQPAALLAAARDALHELATGGDE